MKINNFNPVNINPYKKQMEKNVDAQNIKKEDKVEISKAALELQGTQDEVRLEKIQELKKQISEGTYQVDSKEVAEKILSFWKKS
ncbi:anti-sigma factor repressor of sigma(D)-dependent transcription [Niallia circulans]|uniref:flagellar biosynthesis anti-sigma factor FlgM n=1 Tax=Niallia circulans TaxID=1397 RepID=UPI00077C1DC8|nr:flagellar biosynthesis anti-sigma factor FlgM [Niallia circulans]MDR4316322.1 flagellar biosynthesis anti-sigma factor FlgM [Niallia circulans]MED3838508.1 flagellar biosynthesis anti-sigma factor FlgM [Niallia circulans]MED4243981.1 flagellar biosynthesis anti-sigma factor FlgM [Niallia circulans]MED4246375.1 flagellar biosynthesis anti-sigma factor FlgM [Niallia circulans]QKH62994.1 flagellar biosynthesis anti-sigma factor FlgM [Niallia circulans]